MFLHNKQCLSVINLRHALKGRDRVRVCVCVCVCVCECVCLCACVCVLKKGLVTREGLNVSRRADRCSAEGATLGSCLNPLSLYNNEEGGGGDNVPLPQDYTPTHSSKPRPTPPSSAAHLPTSFPSLQREHALPWRHKTHIYVKSNTW